LTVAFSSVNPHIRSIHPDLPFPDLFDIENGVTFFNIAPSSILVIYHEDTETHPLVSHEPKLELGGTHYGNNDHEFQPTTTKGW